MFKKLLNFGSKKEQVKENLEKKEDALEKENYIDEVDDNNKLKIETIVENSSDELNKELVVKSLETNETIEKIDEVESEEVLEKKVNLFDLSLIHISEPTRPSP